MRNGSQSYNHLLTTKELVERMGRHPDLLGAEKAVITETAISRYKRQGIIPAPLVGRRYKMAWKIYAEEAEEWIAFMKILQRTTPLQEHQVGAVYTAAMREWGASQATLESLKFIFKKAAGDYRTLIRGFVGAGLDLPHEVLESADISVE